MKTLLLFLTFCLSTLTLQAQVVEDECPCNESWADLVIAQNETPQLLMETVSALICEFPYSREISENPIALLRPFILNEAGTSTEHYDEFLYGLETLITNGQKEGYLNTSCAAGLKKIHAHIEKKR